MDGDDNKFL